MGAQDVQDLTPTCETPARDLGIANRLSKHFKVIRQFWRQLSDNLHYFGKEKPNELQTHLKMHDLNKWVANEVPGQPGAPSFCKNIE